MSERAYFSLRYALPGFTFILIVFMIILPNLQTVFSQSETLPEASLVSAFLAFFTLLEGSAIGFLISQPWHLFYDFVLRRQALLSVRSFLQGKEHYELTNSLARLHEQTVFLDYVVHLADKKLLAYLQRRWDLLHTLGSTLVALLLGSLVGVLIRILWTVKDPFPYAIVRDFFVLLLFIFFIAVLVGSYCIVNGEHERMTLIAVSSVWHSGKFPPEDAQKIFPKDYFQEKSCCSE